MRKEDERRRRQSGGIVTPPAKSTAGDLKNRAEKIREKGRTKRVKRAKRKHGEDRQRIDSGIIILYHTIKLLVTSPGNKANNPHT